jgi:hypothetical protein
VLFSWIGFVIVSSQSSRLISIFFLIFCKFLASDSRFRVGAIHPLAPPGQRPVLGCTWTDMESYLDRLKLELQIFWTEIQGKKDNVRFSVLHSVTARTCTLPSLPSVTDCFLLIGSLLICVGDGYGTTTWKTAIWKKWENRLYDHHEYSHQRCKRWPVMYFMWLVHSPMRDIDAVTTYLVWVVHSLLRSPEEGATYLT